MSRMTPSSKSPVRNLQNPPSMTSRIGGFLTGVYKVLIFGDNYRGISSRSRPPEEESQRNDDNVESCKRWYKKQTWKSVKKLIYFVNNFSCCTLFLNKDSKQKKLCNIFQQILISFPIFNTLDLICKCLIVFLTCFRGGIFKEFFFFK